MIAPGADRTWRKPLAVTALLLGVVQLFLARSVLPVLETDESYYKGIAYEIAEHGRWALPLARGFYPGIERSFVPYPPLFFACLASWFKVLGFGGWQNHAFVLLLQLITAALSGRLAAELAARRKGLWACLACLASYSFARLDRPDPLATALAAAALLLFCTRNGSRVRSWAAGLTAAGALCVEPAATVLYGSGLLVIVFMSPVPRKVTLTILLALAGGLALVWGALYLMTPGLFVLFLGQCLNSLLARARALADLRLGGLPSSAIALWGPWFLLFPVLVLPRLRKRGDAAAASGDPLRPLGAAMGSALLVWFFLTPGNATYLMLLFPFVVVAVTTAASRLTGPWGRAALALILLSLLAGSLRPAVDLARASVLRQEDTYDVAASSIRRVVPAGSVVCGDGSLWTLLVQRYEFYDLRTAPGELDRAEYVVSTGSGTGRLGVSGFELGPYGELARSRFELAFDSLLPEPQGFLGLPLGRSRLGYGLRIFRRRSAETGTNGN